MRFLIPIGGGIPAGVLLAKSQGLAWPITAGLYLLSDIILALVFEPILRLLVALASRVPLLTRLGMALKASMASSAAHFSGSATGPIALIMVAFGVDPMTGRAAALAAGHGFLTGWAIALAGDMLYYAVIALATLRLNTWIRNPDTTMWIVLGLMLVVPPLLRRAKGLLCPSPMEVP